RSIRAFIAVRLEAEVERAVGDLIARLRSHDEGVRWTSNENLHLTLKFLGAAVPLAKVSALEQELAPVACATRAFNLEARGVGGSPDLRHPKVLWVGLHGESLNDLAAQVEEACVRCGFSREQRPFTGHLTIGRLKRSRMLRETRARLDEAAAMSFGASTIR